jgi:hypothetical protein
LKKFDVYELDELGKDGWRLVSIHGEVKLSAEEAKQICRLGQLDKCCAFLVMSPTGFECVLMEPAIRSQILKRLEAGTFNAKGTGCWPGCVWEKEITAEKN